MPIPSLKTQDNDYEKIISYKTNQLKLVINLDGQCYSLFALVLFQPPLLPDSIGHYVAALKVKNDFVIFDDLRKSPYCLDQNEDLVIHCLFYKKMIQDDVNDSSFNIDNGHTDDSLYRLYHKN